MFAFQKLEIYQLSKRLVIEVYKLTEIFPEKERYALVQQLNRAVVSVPSNIAEGTSRKGKKEKLHFISISYSSMMEVVCQLEIARDLNYIEEKEFIEITQKVKNLSVKMSNFIRVVGER